MKQVLEFEKPVIALREKIAELKTFTKESDLDLTEEIVKLETRLEKLENDIYTNLKPWDRVQMARHAERPTTLDYVEKLFTDFLEFHGDRYYGDDAAIVAGIAKYKGRPVTIVGHQRGKTTKENIRRNFGMPHPEGFRKAARHMQQAAKFGRPIICFIDTKGAFPGRAAEERGQSEAIARNLMEMSGFEVPIICIVIGEGGSGGALALGVGDRLLMLENSTFSVISPEGAASILWKDGGKAKEAAEKLKITAPDLKELGVIDDIIPEIRGGAHRDLTSQAELVDQAIAEHLSQLEKLDKQVLLEQRWEKYSNIGSFAE
ncbi:acetyl-CoA carboxylase carboxyl transferase subunit alpha [Terribacillus saccharophilus]|uniref:Acetyl-coenzyme A carboxylase carboxyl transferase subunit alpha n=1 Tax=Terribacillus saccharophilus TaxID=361277 RepID=A0A075LL97_9BACI|nr:MULTISPECIES: acetyl-CoA carboxylase carboxyl transferase subunit alpha [Terribacillus]AIF67089.1 acetyl-CoA carboxylase subunit alpha [Terribacillus goriensis]MCM3224151.1 acetyl-CoA carboxylase carboxyl transferase subunit alpha [Terribacillus saccharophilus]MEC0283932.1 acetyl-CoA carboxylase carboxyl transferase subunit alpha [Terribacillus saccharophilus]MEC0290888.1 acetyl-CoA carboxylase carboxyl transferase subunit alpha [Terribacillus saccharophilus]MEC0303735.1 acetyl-CoA carboxyl